MFALSLLVAVPATAGIGAARTSPHDGDPGVTTITMTTTVVSSYRGVTAERWAARFRQRTRQLQSVHATTKRLRRTLTHTPTVIEAINLSCATFGNCGTLWSLARCESQLSPRAYNSSGASGLMQFMPGTFRNTPFGRLSIWSPYASALAAGWMLQQGRRSEWVC